MLQSYPPPSIAESFVSEYFMKALATMHWFLMSERDLERLNLPNTTSALYNFSKDFALSNDPADIAYRENFYLWGYPSDHFAIHYVRYNPWFTFHLQLISFTMLGCFAIMALILAYYTFVHGSNEERNKRMREQDQLLQAVIDKGARGGKKKNE